MHLKEKGCNYHTTPSVPRKIRCRCIIFQHLDDIKFIVVLANIGLIQHCIIVQVHLKKEVISKGRMSALQNNVLEVKTMRQQKKKAY